MSIRFLPAALIAAIVALVAVGGAALAFNLGPRDPEKTDDLLNRAASELGVDAQTLKDALAQAQAEIRTERQKQLLADLVKAEAITQEQADEAAAWLDQMPEAVNSLMRPELLMRLAATGFGDVRPGTPEPHSLSPLFGSDVTEKMAEILGIDAATLEEALSGAHRDQARESRDQAVNDLIDKLVEEGEITQTEGTEIKAWIASMPEWLGDRGMLVGLLAHGIGGGFDSLRFGGFPYSPEALKRLERDFDGNPAHPGLKPGKEPFFFAPNGEFALPPLGFYAPGDPNGSAAPERRFFFRGPEGEFSFQGEVPPEFKHLFDDFNRFRLRPFGPNSADPLPDEPGEGATPTPDSQVNTEKAV